MRDSGRQGTILRTNTSTNQTTASSHHPSWSSFSLFLLKRVSVQILLFRIFKLHVDKRCSVL